MPSIIHLFERQGGPPGPPPLKPGESLSDDRQSDLIVASVVGMVLAILSTIGRVAARRRTKANIGVDDWLIIGGLVMALGVAISTLVMVHYGLGRHVQLVTDPKSLIQSVVSSQILYALSIIPIKLSILALYHRLFPSPNLKLAAIIIGSITILYSVVQAIIMGLQCIPLNVMWDPTVKPIVCLNMSPFYTSMAVINVATDIAILTLPIPYIYNLSLQQARKVQLFAVFMTGAAVIAFGIIRAVNVGSASPDDEPWSDVAAAMWSVLEICVGVVSANLPCLRPLFFWLPSAIRGSTGGTANSGGRALYGPPGANKRNSAHDGNNTYEMARRSRIIANKTAGWESIDDTQGLTRISDEATHEKRVSVAEMALSSPSSTDSSVDVSAIKRNSHLPGTALAAHPPQRGIVVQTTIETSYQSRNGK